MRSQLHFRRVAAVAKVTFISAPNAVQRATAHPHLCPHIYQGTS